MDIIFLFEFLSSVQVKLLSSKLLFIIQFLGVAFWIETKYL